MGTIIDKSCNSIPDLPSGAWAAEDMHLGPSHQSGYAAQLYNLHTSLPHTPLSQEPASTYFHVIIIKSDPDLFVNNKAQTDSSFLLCLS